MIPQIIKSNLSSASIHEPGSVWKEVNLTIHRTADLAIAESHKTQFTMRDLKDLNYNQRVGELWEQFCHSWLLASKKLIKGDPSLIQECWLWHDIPSDIKTYLRLGTSKQDNGIDAIVRVSKVNHDGSWWSRWYPVQCKYRWTKSKGFDVTVTWSNLATFLALVNRTGPPEGWSQHIIMTNCKGVSWKSPKGPKDLVYATGTFKNSDIATWRTMCGQSNDGHLLGQDNYSPTITTANDNNIAGSLPAGKTEEQVVNNELDDLRSKRLARFAM